MKPLNRPMFRYGGPIKEGIMSGMKDRPGYSAGKVVTSILGQIPKQIPKLKNFYSQTLVPKVRNIFGKNVPQNVGTTTIGGKTVQTAGSGQNIFQPNLAGRIILQDPTVRTGTAIVKAVTSPAVKGPVASVARLVFSPTGVATGLYYANGKFFNKDTNEEVPPPDGEVVLGDRVGTSGAPGGGDPNMMGDGSFFAKQAAEAAKKAKSEENEALRQKYYKIMGLDKMKKDAVYDSLIDASRIVSEEGGDLKGSLKSGTLQNKIIQAISGQLDKSAALKKQIDAAILKGEIEKDIAGAKPGSYLKQAEDYAAMKGVSIDQAYKDLGFDKRGDLFEGVQKYFATAKVAPAGNDLATLARSYKVDIAGIEDTTTVKNKMKEKGYDEVGYLTEMLSDPEVAKNVAPGNYVINTRILNVDADKNVTSVF